MKKAFTLIELLVVISIISVLMGIALVSFQGSRKSARDNKRKTDLEQVRNALEMYRADNTTYIITGLVAGNSIGVYLTYPADPVTSQTYYYSGSANTYRICAALESPPTGSTCSIAGANCGSATCNYQVSNP